MSSAASSAKRIHSAYNPAQEAERYARQSLPSYNPLFIVLSEPGESWLACEFRKLVPDATLIVLRYTNDMFLDSDALWDYVWRPSHPVSTHVFLQSLIPEEMLSATLFLPWKPADALWPRESSMVWAEIAGFIKLQQSQLQTRGIFGRAWFRNMLKNALHIEMIVDSTLSNRDVFLAAAGPSLEKSFAAYADSLYLCSTASALSFFSYNKKIPDMCISTDAGYWAREHFQDLPAATILAIPLEAAVPASTLERNPVMVLNFGTSLENSIIRSSGFISKPAERNGTVMGTAASFLLRQTEGSVYAAGLDLSSGLTFSHARPHASDSRSRQSSRVNPFSTYLYERNRASFSLEAYASWFSSRNESFKKRFKRLRPCPFDIPGIASVEAPLPREAEYCANRNSISYIPVLSKSQRASNMRELLDSMKNQLMTIGDPINITEIMFSNQIEDEYRSLVEAIEFSSFGEYLRLIKESRARDSSRYHETAASMVRRTITEIDSLSARLLV